MRLFSISPIDFLDEFKFAIDFYTKYNERLRNQIVDCLISLNTDYNDDYLIRKIKKRFNDLEFCAEKLKYARKMLSILAA